MRKKDMIAFFFGCLALLMFMVTCSAYSAEMECFTDEPKAYIFDLGAQASGRYDVKVEHHSGKLKGSVHRFVVKEVSDLNNSESYLVKEMTKGPKYTITYAMYCKIIKK